jgi:FtsP/CotA-like multicopper oxidase with cupredoxin domain
MKEDENLDARLSRRELLCAAGAGAFALLDHSPLWSGILAGQTRRIVQFNLNLTTGQSQVLPGTLTNVWRFTSSVAKGAPGSIVPIPGSYLGPLIKLKKGDVVKVTVNNLIAEDSVVHWHGLHVPANVDGHPSQSVLPGTSYSSMFPIVNRAGTYWYHPHPDMKTGGQVYNGLAGMIIVSDDEEKALPLPRGNYDLPIVIQDRVCDTGNQWVYVPNSFVGTLGNKILVNGKYTYIENVATRIYRLRILNGSNARIYKLAWDDASPMIVIGTDGGLLAQPASKPYLTLGPGERAEVWGSPDFVPAFAYTDMALKDGRWFVYDVKSHALKYSSGNQTGNSKNGLTRIRCANVDADPQSEVFVVASINPAGLVICYDGVTHAEQFRTTPISSQRVCLLGESIGSGYSNIQQAQSAPTK